MPAQDRARWDSDTIARATELLDRALGAGAPGPFQTEAAIAAVHCRAPTADATEWDESASLYGLIEAFRPTPAVRVNRAFAVGKAKGGGRPARQRRHRLHELSLRSPRSRTLPADARAAVEPVPDAQRALCWVTTGSPSRPTRAVEPSRPTASIDSARSSSPMLALQTPAKAVRRSRGTEPENELDARVNTLAGGVAGLRAFGPPGPRTRAQLEDSCPRPANLRPLARCRLAR